MCKIEDQRETPLAAVCIVVYLCRHWGTRRSLRNPPSHPQLRFPSPCSAKTIRHVTPCVFSCVCSCVCSKKGKLSSSHMNKTRHHSLGSSIFTTVSGAAHTYQPLPVPPFCITFGVKHTHTYTKQCHSTSSGPGLAHSCSPQRLMKEGNHQSNHSHDRYTVIIRLTFSLPPFFAPSKHGGGSRTTITRREVCNYSIARQAGQR